MIIIFLIIYYEGNNNFEDLLLVENILVEWPYKIQKQQTSAILRITGSINYFTVWAF